VNKSFCVPKISPIILVRGSPIPVENNFVGSSLKDLGYTPLLKLMLIKATPWLVQISLKVRVCFICLPKSRCQPSLGNLLFWILRKKVIFRKFPKCLPLETPIILWPYIKVMQNWVKKNSLPMNSMFFKFEISALLTFVLVFAIEKIVKIRRVKISLFNTVYD
jgi:hypothetical protein